MTVHSSVQVCQAVRNQEAGGGLSLHHSLTSNTATPFALSKKKPNKPKINQTKTTNKTQKQNQNKANKKKDQTQTSLKPDTCRHKQASKTDKEIREDKQLVSSKEGILLCIPYEQFYLKNSLRPWNSSCTVISGKNNQ